MVIKLKYFYFLKILFIHTLIIFPFNCLQALDSTEESCDIQGRQIHKHFLEALKEAQPLIHGLRVTAFTRQSTGTKEWPVETRKYLKEIALNYERLTWDLKTRLDATLGCMSSLSHTLPQFDDNGEPILSDPFYFTYTSSKKDCVEKRFLKESINFPFLFEHEAHIHEIAYKSILRYVETLLKFILSSEFDQTNFPLPSSLQISHLSDLHNKRLALLKVIREMAEPFLEIFGFPLVYESKRPNALTTVHIADQKPNGFRTATKTYLKDKKFSDEQMKDAYQWLHLKISRLERILKDFSTQLPWILDALQRQRWLVASGVNTTIPRLLLSNDSLNYTDFSVWFRHTYGHHLQVIPFPMDIMRELTGTLQTILSLSGLAPDHRRVFSPDRNDPASNQMFRTFCNISEKRMHLSDKTNKEYVPAPLRTIYSQHLVPPVKKYPVKVMMGKKLKTLYTTYQVDFSLTPWEGEIKVLSMEEFEAQWKRWSHKQRQLHLALELLEYFTTVIESSVLRIYQQPIEDIFLRLNSEHPSSDPFTTSKRFWNNHSDAIRQQNIDRIHLMIHSSFPEFNLPNLLRALVTGPDTYTSINCALSYDCTPEEFSRMHSYRQLTMTISRVFSFNSPLVPSPAPATTWKPKESSAVFVAINSASLIRAIECLKKPAPKAPSFPEGVTFEKKDKRGLIEQINKTESRTFYKRLETAYDVFLEGLSNNNQEFPELIQMAHTYYSAHLPISWADLSDYAKFDYVGPEYDEFIKQNFPPFFKWYWNNIEMIRKGRTPEIQASDKVSLTS